MDSKGPTPNLFPSRIACRRVPASVSDGVISVSSTQALLAAMRTAQTIALGAYVLPNRDVTSALEAAADRGARVTVALEAAPFADTRGALAAANRRAVAQLAAHGIHARVAPGIHLKAAAVDGVAYLDDRNFVGGRETVVRDRDASDARALVDAIARGTPRSSRRLQLCKRDALAAEARTLRAGRPHAVDVESETFGCASAAYSALRRFAGAGVRCRLLVTASELRHSVAERRAIRTLLRCGVEVRCGDAREKLAIIDKTRAWVGSANATSSYFDGDQLDWSVSTQGRVTVRALAGRFEENWRASRAVREA